MMDTLNIGSTIRKMTVNELGDFIFESYYKRIGIVKESSYYSIKHQKKKDPNNVKGYNTPGCQINVQHPTFFPTHPLLIWTDLPYRLFIYYFKYFFTHLYQN